MQKASQLDYLRIIDKLSASLGNRYAAVKFVSVEARKICNKYRGYVSESEAINWVLDNQKPESATRFDRVMEKINLMAKASYKHTKSVTDEYLSYVDDPGVCQSVRACVKASKEARHLVYVYINLDNDSQRARVRILTRMIWFSL